MRYTRSLRAFALSALFLFVLIVVTMIVASLAGLVEASIVLAVTVVALLVARLAAKRVPRGTVLEVDFDKGVVEQPPINPLDRMLNMGSLVVRDVVDALDRAAEDERVAGLVARVGNGRIGLAQAQEIRDAVERFRDAGKTAVAYSEGFGENGLATTDYYLATAFTEIHLIPMGIVAMQGVLTRSPFLRNLFDRVGAIPDFDHRGEYKAVKYLFTEEGYVAPHREATTAILEDHLGQIVSGIAQDRGLEPSRVRQLIDQAPQLDSEALSAGLVDHISYRDGAYQSAGASEGRCLYLDSYLKRAGRPHRRGERIALIYGTGSIHRGRTRFDPLERTSSLGADDLVQAIREAREDKKARAIVMRVDSPGGSAVASEVVYREVIRAREAGKPVVVSMGNVAGSGGYFIAVPADRIVAQPGTITGSIGVVSGKVATRETWRRLGINWDSIQLGRNATMFVPDGPFSDSERERLEAGLDAVYEGFKERVAVGRSLTPERVEEIAKGRVWTGQRAAELGLVDHLGGLDRAVEVAAELGGVEAGKPVQLRLFPRQRAIPLTRRKEGSEPINDVLAALLDPGLALPRAGFEMRMSSIRAH